MSIQSAAQRVAVAKAVGDMLRRVTVEARGDFTAAAQEAGVVSVRVHLPAGELGMVTMTRGRSTPVVADERAFLAWVTEHAPGEVVTAVRDSYRRHVLDQVKQTGELPPGVEMRDGDPYPTVRLAPGAEQVALEAIRSGDVDPLALPGGAP